MVPALAVVDGVAPEATPGRSCPDDAAIFVSTTEALALLGQSEYAEILTQAWPVSALAAIAAGRTEYDAGEVGRMLTELSDALALLAFELGSTQIDLTQIYEAAL